MKSFNVLALNSNFQIVGIVAFINLQWSRKWHECGTFSISVPLEQYSNDWKYIYTKDRPEVGEITQINYLEQNGAKMMFISGYFLEKELDKMVCYKKNTTTDERTNPNYYRYSSMSNITGDSVGFDEHVTGTADFVAKKYFEGFKSINFYDYKSVSTADLKHFELDISTGNTQQGTYKQSDHYRNNESLGWKCYDILKPSGASYRVRFDFDTLKKYFDVLIGKDKTQDNTSGLNPILFSTKYGNVINPNVVISNETYSDCVITANEYPIKPYGSQKTDNYISVNAKCIDGAKGYFTYEATSVKASDFRTHDEVPELTNLGVDLACYNTQQYKVAISDEFKQILNEKAVSIVNIEFDSSSSSYEYIEDFDIGDLVSLEIPEIGLSADVRLIGCYEVIEDGKWNLSMEFGTPILK